jgi:hypothetical protein
VDPPESSSSDASDSEDDVGADRGMPIAAAGAVNGAARTNQPSLLLHYHHLPPGTKSIPEHGESPPPGDTPRDDGESDSHSTRSSGEKTWVPSVVYFSCFVFGST